MPSHNRPTQLLGGLSPTRFLRQRWQKAALLVRSAIDGFTGLLSPRELMALACKDEVQARVVIHQRSRWDVHHGPFRRSFFQRLPAHGWTLLVQDLNHVLPTARELLERFNFIPYARLDDLMVSYAPPGGGVGPHFDSYDVFLLQGLGKRRWRVSYQRDLELLPGAALKLLADFRVEQEWVLHPGDMLYLPPACAHDGVAIEPCMTYSIGFRAPAWQELAVEFLSFLQDRITLDGLYADPGLRPSAHPARLGRGIVRAAAERLNRIRWRESDVERFLGCYLTEPKPYVRFHPPARALSLHAFCAQARRRGVTLALRSQMLYAGKELFINGECEALDGAAGTRLRELADSRILDGSALEPDELLERLYGWYRAGYLELRGASGRKTGAG